MHNPSSSIATQSASEFIRCDLCGSDEERVIFPFPFSFPDGRRGGIVKCRTCGFIHRNVDLTEQGHYEEQKYASLSSEWVEGRKRAFRDYMESLAAFRQENRILDVGCGHGFFLAACLDQGWQCTGVEIAREAVAFARDRFGLTIANCPLEAAHYPAGRFDVVTFWNVLDQIPHPLQTLREVHRVLRPGGALVARVPNADFHVTVHRCFVVLRRFFPGLKNFDQTVAHLCSFDARSIRKMVAKAGFVDIRVSVAHLGWTTRHDSPVGKGKRIVANLVQKKGEFLGWISGGRLLITPSLVVWAVKP
jgi:2-polyprenyl-3-methyl-5-hydroxy-6-metoxy-1,4-benzoquinol methylase